MMTTLSQDPKHFGPQCTSLYCCVDQSLVTSIPSTNFVCKKVCRGEKRNISQSFAVSATFCSIQQSSICTSTPLGQRKAKRGLSWKAPNRHTSLIEYKELQTLTVLFFSEYVCVCRIRKKDQAYFLAAYFLRRQVRIQYTLTFTDMCIIYLRAPRAPLFRNSWVLCNVLCPVQLMSLHDIRFQPLFEYEAYIYYIICDVYAAVESEGPFTLNISLKLAKVQRTKMLIRCQKLI